MDWMRILISAVGMLTMSVLMHLVTKGLKTRVVKNEKGETALRLHKVYLYAGYPLLAGAIFFMGVALYLNELEMYIIAAVLMFFGGGLGLACVLSYHNHRLTFDDRGFTWQNWRKKSVRITWKGIETVKFNPITYYLVVRSLNKKASINSRCSSLKTR